MGKKVDSLLPIPPTALQLSTGVAVLSYGDELVFGITAGYAARTAAAGIDQEMARLVALGQNFVLLFREDRREGSAARTCPRRPVSTPTARARR